MHPRTRELLSHLDTTRQVLETAVDAVPAADRVIRPAPDRWSVADILEHLVIVETRILSLFRGALTPERLAALGPETDTSSVLATLDVAALIDRAQRRVSGAASLPTGAVSADESRAALTDRRRALRDAVIATDGYALGGVTAPHPRLGDLSGYQWILFLGAHEARHAAQIDEVRLTLASRP